MITAKQWKAYHRCTPNSDWRDVAAVQKYLKNQRPSPFSMPFWSFSKLFKAYYARLYGWGDPPRYGYFSIPRQDIVNYWQRGFMPSQAANYHYSSCVAASEADYRDWAKEEQAWRNWAATGDPDISAHDLYKHDGIGWD